MVNTSSAVVRIQVTSFFSASAMAPSRFSGRQAAAVSNPMYRYTSGSSSCRISRSSRSTKNTVDTCCTVAVVTAPLAAVAAAQGGQQRLGEVRQLPDGPAAQPHQGVQAPGGGQGDGQRPRHGQERRPLPPGPLGEALHHAAQHHHQQHRRRARCAPDHVPHLVRQPV